MKKFLTVLVLLAVIVVGGGWYAKHAVTSAVSTQVSKELNSPEGQKALRQVLNSPLVQAQLQKESQSGDANPVHFGSQQQAISFAVSKLSPGETAQLANDYVHRKSLSNTQKIQAEQVVLSKFTPDQLRAMAQAAAQK